MLEIERLDDWSIKVNAWFWRKSKDKMENTSNEKCKSSCIGQAAGPELENVLYCCILEERKKGIPIATV